MLEIHLPEKEYFDRINSKIRKVPEINLVLEHSLFTIAQWETKWEAPFLSETQKTTEQLVSYISIMAGEDLSEETIDRLTTTDFNKIKEFLNAKHSATWFSDSPGRQRSTQVTTTELIYYWMTAYNIPFECERWHLARLMNLIRIASIKNDPEPKKRKKSEMLSERAALNAKRRAEMQTKG